MYIAGQILGICGMVSNILVFQQKAQKRVLAWQFLAACFFCANYFMVGAVVGGMLNLVGAIRAAVFFFDKQTHANHFIWLIFFILAFSASYPMTFLLFNTEQSPKNFIIEILPVIAMIVATVAIKLGSSKMVRRLGLISSPLWLTYNCFSGSIGAILSEILNLISIVVGIVRIDLKKKGERKNV